MKKILIFVIVIALALTVSIFAAPGDSSDPIVVLSYLEDTISTLIEDYHLEKIEVMQEDIDDLQQQLETKTDVPAEDEESSVGKGALEIVEIYNGEKLICKAGAELILRGGKATVVGGELGGLSNVTIGSEFVTGMEFPDNNLFIVPRDDRGATTLDSALFMVRGEYEIVK